MNTLRLRWIPLNYGLAGTSSASKHGLFNAPIVIPERFLYDGAGQRAKKPIALFSNPVNAPIYRASLRGLW